MPNEPEVRCCAAFLNDASNYCVLVSILYALDGRRNQAKRNEKFDESKEV